LTLHPVSAGINDALPRVRVRWRIFLFMFLFGFVAYFQQRTLSVAGVRMMPELGLSQMQLGLLETAFLIGYTAMQFPGGVMGQRLGARVMFVLIGLLGFAATIITPLAPLLLSGAALLVLLVAAQLLLGSSQAPIFPVSAGVFETWFRPEHWPLVQGLQTMGLGLGAALTPLLISRLMVGFGWQRAVLWTAMPALILIGWWAWYGRNSPAEHPAVGKAELAELGAAPGTPPDDKLSWRRMGALLIDRDVLALTLSYICMNYVFYLLANWCFLYLVQERHFQVLESGHLAVVPPLGAALGAGLGGWLASRLCARLGVRRGLRMLPLISLPAAALLLFLAVDAANPYVAVAILSLCFAAVELNEGSYWAAIMHVGRGDTMAASGVLNTGGNFGGIIATPIVAYLSGHHAWTQAFLLGSGFAIVSAALWLSVDPLRRSTGESATV
jgi:MFS transporter, ACS family, glucarate transporter